MGVLQRFERRLGGLVEGAFAKVFKGGVEPVEIASALARETDDRRAVSSNRVLVPNEFAVELASGDFARLSPYDRALCDELAEMVREHAAEQRYTFVGPVAVQMSEAADLDVGVFRIRSSVASTDQGVVAGRRPRSRPAAPGTPHLLITTKAAGSAGGEREYPLDAETTVIGRSVECDIRLTDTGVSRRHGEISRLPDGQFLYVDAGSTNGSLVNGRAATQVKLVNGDRIELGTATIVFRRDTGRNATARPAGRSTPAPERAAQRATNPPDRRATPPPVDDPYRRGSDPRGGRADGYPPRGDRSYPAEALRSQEQDLGRDRPARAASDPARRPSRPDHDRPRPAAGGRERGPDESTGARRRAAPPADGYQDRDFDAAGRDGRDGRPRSGGLRDGGVRGAASRGAGSRDAVSRSPGARDSGPRAGGAREGGVPAGAGRDRGVPGERPASRDRRGDDPRRAHRDEYEEYPDGPSYPEYSGYPDSRRPPATAAGPQDDLEPLDDLYDAQTFLPGQLDAPRPGDDDRGRRRPNRGSW